MLEAFLYRHDFCSKGLRLEPVKITPITCPSHRHRPASDFRHDFHRRFKALLLLGARRDMKYRGYTPEESHIPLLQAFFVGYFWWFGVMKQQLLEPNYGYLWFPSGFLIFDVVTICYIFNVSPNIHACWIILQRMSISCCETFLIFVNVFFFVNLAVPKQVLEVSMKYQASWHDHTNMAAIPKSCWFVELWFRHIGDDRKVPRYAERRQRRWGGYEDVLKVFEETRGTIKIERPEVKTNEIRKCPAYAKMFHILMFNWEIKAIYNN